MENTHVLMHPQADHAFLVLAVPGLDEQDTRETLGDVAEVEGVMGFRGSRQKFLADTVENLDRRLDHGLPHPPELG